MAGPAAAGAPQEEPSSRSSDGRRERSKQQALKIALDQIEKQHGKGRSCGWARGRSSRWTSSRRVHFARRGAGDRRDPARAGHRDLRAGVLRQDHPLPPRHRRGAEDRRDHRIRGRRARAGHGVRQEARGGREQPAPLAAGIRRAGAGDRGDPGAQRRARCDRHRFRGGPHAAGRDRRGDGGSRAWACRPGSCRRPCASSPPPSASPRPP